MRQSVARLDTRQIARRVTCNDARQVALDSEPGGRWISYAELAEIRGTDKTSALKLALRKKWPRRKDNHGTMHVHVPPEWLGTWGSRRPPDNTPNVMPSSVPNGVDISRSISALEMALASADKRADQAEKRADRTEIRAEQAEAGPIRPSRPSRWNKTGRIGPRQAWKLPKSE